MFTQCVITKLDPDPERAPMQATLAGLQVGDVITHINGQVTQGCEGYMEIVVNVKMV